MPIRITKPDGTIIDLTPDSWVFEGDKKALEQARDALKENSRQPITVGCTLRPVYPEWQR